MIWKKKDEDGVSIHDKVLKELVQTERKKTDDNLKQQ
jgi:hypothetical protein